MTVLVHKKSADEPNVMDDIKEVYFQNATLYLEEKDKEEFEESKPDFLKFL